MQQLALDIGTNSRNGRALPPGKVSSDFASASNQRCAIARQFSKSTAPGKKKRGAAEPTCAQI